MSALGHKRTCAVQNRMSALPPIADICSAQADVRFVPKADVGSLWFTIHQSTVAAQTPTKLAIKRCAFG